MVISEFKSRDFQRPQNFDFLADSVNFSNSLKSIQIISEKKVWAKGAIGCGAAMEGVWRFTIL